MRGRRNIQRGQVMILAVAVLLVLLSAALILFDFHNVLRAKIKVESAEEAAALAGAQWQVIGLNMIGQINLIKASTLMIEEAEDIPSPAFTAPENVSLTAEELEKRRKKHRLAARLRTLDETQARISFVIPVLGYMAVQQTAKQNGMSGDNGLLKYYHDETLPLNDYRYMDVKGYLWYEPYRQLIGEAAEQRSPVRCNARVSELPEVWSNPEGSLKIDGGGSTSFALLLSTEDLYSAIDHRNYCYWQLRKMAKLGVHLGTPWWKIEYIPGQFIQESEILPLGVDFGDGADVETLLSEGRLKGQSAPSGWNTDPELQPDSWCKYDSKWYGSSFVEADYREQQKYWAGNLWLRSDRKKGYFYEGAISAVDGAVSTSRSMLFKMRRQNKGGIGIADPVAARSSASTITVGHKPDQRSSCMGVVAKVFGGFNDHREEADAPNATEVILPVFSRGLLVPCRMPYGVGMLTRGDGALKRFLQWLATHPDIYSEEPPEGTAWYLEQLRKLEDPDFIRSIYNTAFPGVDAIDPIRIFERSYFFPDDPNGAGWLQRAYLARVGKCPTRIVYTGKVLPDGTKETTTEPAVPDDTVTELAQTYVDAEGVLRRYYTDFANATRVYYGNRKTGYYYYVKRNGRIQTNEKISCDGNVYCGSGTMSPGTGSGPDRLP